MTAGAAAAPRGRAPRIVVVYPAASIERDFRVSAEPAVRAREAMIQLASQPPGRVGPGRAGPERVGPGRGPR